MPLNVRHLTGPAALAEVGTAFDDLASATALPFTARRLWLQSWVDSYPAWEPWVVVVDDGADLVAAAPLARRRRGGVRQVVLLGHGPTDDARLPAATPDAARALARAVATELQRSRLWRLQLRQLPTEDDVVAELQNLLPHSEVRPGQGMPLVEVSGDDPDAILSKNTRKALAKIRNRLRDRAVDLHATWTRDADEVVGLLPELMRVHRERDLALGRRPDHDDPSAAAFYREVITRHASEGQVDLLTLRLDGDLAAYVCGFADGRVLRSWDNRLAPRWADLSAGRLANTEALRHVVLSPEYDALDWMRGEEPYKLQSATTVVPTCDVDAWSSAALRRTDLLAGVAREGLRDALRRNTAAVAAVRRVRRFRAGGHGADELGGAAAH